MRKMFSQKQIIDLIKNAILDGDIVIPEELPDVSTATAGQILALNADKEPAWVDAPEELPATASASAGQMLALDSDKNPQWTNVPEELPDQTGASEGDVLKIGADGLEWGNAGGNIDSDVTVEIENNYSSDDYQNRTNYADPITLQEFIAHCEAGDYTNAGIIAKVNNLLSGATFRLILIGVNDDYIAYNEALKAKTTWQFLDTPEHNIPLGLPFNVLDWDSGGNSRAKLKAYIEGTNESAQYLYPSNMDGLLSARGLMEAVHVIFEELPDTLKRHIKTVTRYYYRKREWQTVNAESGGTPGSESTTGVLYQFSANIFHLSAVDLGVSGGPDYEGKGSSYAYFSSNSRRKRYYNGESVAWHTASPRQSTTNEWIIIMSTGSASYVDNYSGYRAIAPAFCI